MADDAALVGDGYHDISILVEFALARQARVVAGIAGTVNVIFFAVAHFGQQVFAALHIDVAGAAAAYAAAVVVQGYVVIKRYFQHGFTGFNIHGNRCLCFIFELKGYVAHIRCKGNK